MMYFCTKTCITYQKNNICVLLLLILCCKICLMTYSWLKCIMWRLLGQYCFCKWDKLYTSYNKSSCNFIGLSEFDSAYIMYVLCIFIKCFGAIIPQSLGKSGSWAGYLTENKSDILSSVIVDMQGTPSSCVTTLFCIELAPLAINWLLFNTKYLFILFDLKWT